MTTSPSAPSAPDTPTVVPTPELTLTREGKSTFTAGNGRGGTVLVGPDKVDGAFTPGELLKIAVAGCIGMSADHRLANLLGDEFEGTVSVVAHKDEANERYSHFEVTLSAPPADLDPERLEHGLERAQSLIEKNCTVGRTLAKPAPYHVTFEIA